MSVSDLATLGVSVLPHQDENIGQIQLLDITKEEFYCWMQVSFYFFMYVCFLAVIVEWIGNK